MLMCPYADTEAGPVPGIDNVWYSRCGEKWVFCRMSEETRDASGESSIRCERVAAPKGAR